jgi:hypothetical protein
LGNREEGNGEADAGSAVWASAGESRFLTANAARNDNGFGLVGVVEEWYRVQIEAMYAEAEV